MIKIVGLTENTALSSAYKAKHGLSIYIETAKHKILFDLGPDDLFLRNARKLNVNVSEIDTVVISHGHVDHCGGLKCFLENNDKAKIYIRKQATDSHYVKVFGLPFYAGIDKRLVDNERLMFTDKLCVIDDELTLFSCVSGDFPLPVADKKLFVRRDGKITLDDFDHEQNLILTAGGKTTLFCGCAHAGIVNVLDKAHSIIGDFPNAVVGGFHLYEPTTKKYESAEYIARVTDALLARKSDFLTCHCTGEKAFELMKKTLGDRLDYLRAGSSFTLYR